MAAHDGWARTVGRAQEVAAQVEAEAEAEAEAQGQHPPSGFEYRSRLHVWGLPLVHVVRGIDPSTGRRPAAVGIIAIGQVAIGLVAIGQVAVGLVGVGQAAVGLGWGIGQLAFGLLAAGQVAAGVLGSVGQIATGPHALGMVSDPGSWVSLGWLVGGLCLAVAVSRRRRALQPILAGPPSAIGDVEEGAAYVTGEIVTIDGLRAPLSSRPCVFWHAVAVGPGVRTHEHGGGEVTIADATGTARIDFQSEVVFLRADGYHEMVGPDWALHLETALARGDTVHVAGPVALSADPAATAGPAHRGGLSPLFAGRSDAPLIVTTRSPTLIRASLRFASVVGWVLSSSGVLAIAYWIAGR